MTVEENGIDETIWSGNVYLMILRNLFMFLSAFVLSACTAASETPQSHAPAKIGTLIDLEPIQAKGLPPQRVTIWLPPGYERSDTRYPVLYMHDAQNLFDPALSNYSKIWKADQVMHAVSENGDIREHIIIGLWHPGAARYRQYLPQKLYDRAHDALRKSMDEHAGGEPIMSDAYLAFIVDQLKPMIDRDYRTLTGRSDTSMAGSSMGGLISFYALGEYPDVFGRVAAVSIHWPLADPGKAPALDPQIAALWKDYIVRDLGKPDGRRLWMDHGTETLDAFYPPYQVYIDTALAEAGWQQDHDFTSRTYEGAEHDEIAWNTRLPEIFRWLLSEDEGQTEQ